MDKPTKDKNIIDIPEIKIQDNEFGFRISIIFSTITYCIYDRNGGDITTKNGDIFIVRKSDNELGYKLYKAVEIG